MARDQALVEIPVSDSGFPGLHLPGRDPVLSEVVALLPVRGRDVGKDVLASLFKGERAGGYGLDCHGNLRKVGGSQPDCQTGFSSSQPLKQLGFAEQQSKKLQEYEYPNMKSASLMNTRAKLARLSLPLSYWTGLIGILAVATNFFLEPDSFTNLWTIPATALNLVCLMTVPRFPLPTWVGYLVLFLLLSVQPDIRITVFTFIAPVIATLVAYRGHPVAAAGGSVLLWYAGSVNLTAGVLVPPDLLASVIWAVFLATAVLIGHVLHRIITQRKDLMGQWDNDVRTRRETLARALHDSVATSLTSVVMRAETLSLQQGLTADTQAELTAIADHARTSMKEVRGLLRVLNGESSHRPADSEPPAADQLHQVTDFLKAHGFTVDATGARLHLPLDADSLVILREILAEIATNIIKYAEPRSTVNLAVEHHESHATISFTNTVSSRTQDSHLATGLGLPAITQLAASVGGAIRMVSNSTHWKTQLRLPQLEL